MVGEQVVELAGHEDVGGVDLRRRLEPVGHLVRVRGSGRGRGRVRFRVRIRVRVRPRSDTLTSGER